jgi:hypothetical protein
MKVSEYYRSDAKMGKERRMAAKDKAEVLQLNKKVYSLEKKLDTTMAEKPVDNTVLEKLVDERLR